MHSHLSEFDLITCSCSMKILSQCGAAPPQLCRSSVQLAGVAEAAHWPVCTWNHGLMKTLVTTNRCLPLQIDPEPTHSSDKGADKHNSGTTLKSATIMWWLRKNALHTIALEC